VAEGKGGRLRGRGPSNGLTRRQFLRVTGAGLAGTALLGAAGCGRSASSAAGGADGDKWKQFSGMTLNFISENTPPTSAIAANLTPFKDLTGIDVSISQLELTAVQQKVALDFGARTGQYPIVYADPYNIMVPLRDGLIDLKNFNRDDSLPSVPRSLDDFIQTQLDAAGRFGDALLTLPYDCPTLIWCYRKDLFEKHHDRMKEDLGFDPTPSISVTWDQYYEMAEWFNENADEVSYGTGHQAKQFTSLTDDFANVLWAYGGDFFENGQRVGRFGATDPGPSTLDRPEAIQAATFYKKLVDAAHPGSTSWDWNDLAEAFGAGEVAMCPEWHEFAGAWWVPGGLQGKVGFSPLPTGPARSANHYGGTGIGVNRYASEDEQKAAWLFVVWATSPELQLLDLKSSVGGGTPTRTSVYEMPQVKKNETPPTSMPNILTAPTMREAWKPENIGLRPKTPTWNQCDAFIYTELSEMLAGGKSPEEAMRSAKRGVDRTTKGAASAV
jgi:multiple sugar transport system substrate-binding protein